MLTTEQTIEAYHKNQEHFEGLDNREQSEEELLYHLKQMHRLLYILVGESKNKNKKWYKKLQQTFK